MKKIFFSLITPLCLLGVLVLPESGFAFMTTLSEAGMRSATAQAGINLSVAESRALKMELNTVVYGDAGSQNVKDAYLGMKDVFLLGEVTNATNNGSVLVDVTTELSPYTGRLETGVNITLQDYKIDAGRFEIGSIMMGAIPGSIGDLGSIVVQSSGSTISGNIRITTH